MDPPFTTFQGELKQVNLEAADERSQGIFEYFFPRFGDLEREAEDEVRRGVTFRVTSAYMGDAGRGRERRFAGDTTFPRGCYYTLAHRPSEPPDRNTLVRELFAYHSAKAGIRMSLLDNTVDTEVLEMLRRQGAACPGEGPRLLLILNPDGPLGFPEELHVPDDVREIVIPFPLTVVSREIGNVVDLRQPATLAWLVRTVGNKRTSGCEDADDYLQEFANAVLNLVNPVLGGGTIFIQQIAASLRASGACALIYPSARTDCGVEVHNGVLKWVSKLD